MEINGEIVSENVRYADLGLSEPIMKALEKKGYEQATPVQGGAIPYFMEYKDVIAKAPTGTGKTFAFGIPMVEHIDPGLRHPHGGAHRPGVQRRAGPGAGPHSGAGHPDPG